MAPLGVALFALLDLYTMHFVALPYYAGLIAHRPNGMLAAFHPAGVNLSDALSRLHAFKPGFLSEPLLASLWIVYLAATLSLVVIAFLLSRRVTDPK
jgi:hypothetical protein